jgi:hypothetical protein
MATTKWRITRQDKTRYDNTGELRALLIHQLVLVCWRAVPQTISFYNPEPSYLEMSRRGYTAALLQCCQVCTVACCNTETWQQLLVPTFVLSDPGHDNMQFATKIISNGYNCGVEWLTFSINAIQNTCK